MTITTDLFLAGVKRLISVPRNQNMLRTDDFLEITQRKMQDTVLPTIDAINQEYFLWKSTEPLVAEQADYRIPARAVGRKLRDLKLIDPSGNRREIALVAVEREHQYGQTGNPHGFYFYGDRVSLVPVPSSAEYTLQFWWFLGPGKPVLGTSACRVVSVAGDDVTVDAVPAGVITATSTLDFIQGTPGNGYLAISKAVTGIAGSVISFAADAVPLDLAAGDYLTLEGYSPVIQLPTVATYFLMTLVAQEVCFSIGDFEAYDRLEKISTKQLENLNKQLEPRIEGEPIVIMNQFGLVGGRRGNARWLFT